MKGRGRNGVAGRALNGQAAVVTGAASGIGRGIAERFAREGARIVIADIDESGAETAANAIRSRGGEAVVQRTDVGDEASVRALMDAAAERWGSLHVIVNSAGIDNHQPATEMSVETYDRVLAVNLRSMFLTAKYGAAHIQASGGGSIINISSVMAWCTASGYAAYTAAKAGIVGITRTLALELGPDIRVNTICPGFIDTPLWERVLSAMPPEEARSFAQRITGMHPLQRRGTPADVAAAALFLASDEAAFVSGAHLVIDGGLSGKLINE